MLDEAAFDDALADDPDETLALLADLTGATDEGLRMLARRLAGRVVVDLARTGEHIVAVRQGLILATAFHPEVTGDLRVHRLFVDMVTGPA